MTLQIFSAYAPERLPAEDREILGEEVDDAAIDLAIAGDDTVARDPLRLHAEVGAAMRDEPVELDERAGVEKLLDPLARRVLAGGVLSVDAGLTAAEARGLVECFESFEIVAHVFLARLSAFSGQLGASRSYGCGSDRRLLEAATACLVPEVGHDGEVT